MNIQRGDIVKFKTSGRIPKTLEGEAILFVPAGANVYDDVQTSMKMTLLPVRRRRFKEVNKRSNRYIVAVHRKGVDGGLLNSIDYYAPVAERVEKA